MSKYKKKNDWAIFVGLLLIAIVTRVYGLSQWPLVGDEYHTYNKAYERLTSFVNPAYYFLTVVSFKFFGVSEWAARLPACVLGIFSVPVFYLTWNRVIGRNAAVVSALFVLFSSWHLWYSQSARFYSGVFLFASLAYYFFYRSIREDRFAFLAWSLLTMVLAILFHLTAALIPVSLGAYCFAVVLFRSSRAQNSIRVSAVFLGICIIIGLAALPFSYETLKAWENTGQKWGYNPILFGLQILKYVQVPIAVSAFFGGLILLHKDRWTAIFFGFSIIVPILFLLPVSAVSSVRPDYAFYTLPLIIGLAGVLCGEIIALDRDRRFASVAVSVLIIVSLLPEFASHFTGKVSLDARDAISFIEREYQPGDRVVSFADGGVIGQYSKRTLEKSSVSHYVYDNSVDWASALHSYKNSSTRTWIILPISRKLPAKGLDKWLLLHGNLMWRKVATRFDYTHKGYEIFLVDARPIDL